MMRPATWVLLLAAGAVLPARAQAPPALGFHGLAPGMPRAALAEAVRGHGGTLRCRTTPEPRLEACSAALRLPAGEAATLTASLVDGHLGVALVAARLEPAEVGRWHADLVDRFGDVPVERRAGQERFQWIRDRRMLRLTVRREGGGLTASVSVVDGRLLDDLPPP